MHCYAMTVDPRFAMRRGVDECALSPGSVRHLRRYSCGRDGQDRGPEIRDIFSLKTPCDWRFHCFYVTMHDEVGSERTTNKIVIILYLCNYNVYM